MPFSITDLPGRRILKLEGSVTILHAQDLAGKLAESPDYGASVMVDTKNLEDMDTCMLQLLCSLRKAVPSLSFDNPSEAFIRALDRCGMRRELLGGKDML